MIRYRFHEETHFTMGISQCFDLELLLHFILPLSVNLEDSELGRFQEDFPTNIPSISFLLTAYFQTILFTSVLIEYLENVCTNLQHHYKIKSWQKRIYIIHVQKVIDQSDFRINMQWQQIVDYNSTKVMLISTYKKDRWCFLRWQSQFSAAAARS